MEECKAKTVKEKEQKKKKEREDKKIGEEMRKKAMEGLVSSEYATFFCMALTNMPFRSSITFHRLHSKWLSYLLSGTFEEHD